MVVCAGSRALEAAYPGDATQDSIEGDAAHWAMAELLHGRDIDVGLVAANGVTLNVEMVEAAEMAAEHIKARPCGVGDIEVSIPEGPLHPLNYGTPDHGVVNLMGHIFVDDFKYGRGLISEFRNWQLINYVALIAHKRGLLQFPNLQVTMTIIQPRCYHRRGPIRSVTTTLGEMASQFDELRAAFNAAMHPNAQVIASDPDQCRNCSGRHVCEASLQAAQLAVPVAYESTPLVLSPAALSKELRILRRAEKQIKLRREGIEEATLAELRRGKPVPYFRVEHTAGRKVFREDAKETGLLDVAAAYNVTLTKDALITPLQAIKAGMPKEVIELYSHNPGGAAELVEDDGTFAANIFKG